MMVVEAPAARTIGFEGADTWKSAAPRPVGGPTFTVSGIAGSVPVFPLLMISNVRLWNEVGGFLLEKLSALKLNDPGRTARLL